MQKVTSEWTEKLAYATEFRYPGESASQETAEEAIEFCRMIRSEIRNLLHLYQ